MLGQRMTGQNQIDAQSQIAAEPGRTIIPPTETGGFLFKAPERIAESERQNILQRGALSRTAQYLFAPGFGVVHIAIVGSDIEISQYHHPRIKLELRVDIRGNVL